MSEPSVLTYHLRIESKTLSHLIPFDTSLPSAPPSYDIHYRSPLPIPHSGPDISISRLSSTAILGRAGFHHSGDGNVAFYPCARLTVNPSLLPGRDILVEMAAPDFKNWTFTFCGTRYIWRLKVQPACLKLASQDFSPHMVTPIIARFTYSRSKNTVVSGGRVGTLEIWEKGLLDLQGDSRKESNFLDPRGELPKEDILEVVVMGYLTVAKHLEGLGKFSENDDNVESVAKTAVHER